MRIRQLAFGTFSVSMAPEEAERLQRVSILKGMDMNSFVKAAILNSADEAECSSGLQPEQPAENQDDDNH